MNLSFKILLLCLWGHLLSANGDESDDSNNGIYASYFTNDEYEQVKEKRIRREIRDITSDQWDRVSNALNIMKHTSQSQGQSLYGPAFRNYDALVCQHTQATYHPNGDMGHFGPQFLLWHRIWSLSVENSLIAIDPNIESAPYWDWRRDIPDDGVSVSADLVNSIVFSDDYLGDYTGNPDYDYALTNGKFAFWEVNSNPNEVGCGEFYQNPYGLLRSRTNVNNNKYVTRIGGNVCGGEWPIGNSIVYEQCLTQVQTSIYDFFWCMDSSIHSSPHVGIGGTHLAYDGQYQSPGPSFDCLSYIFAGNLFSPTFDRLTEARFMAYNWGCLDCPDASECGTAGDIFDFECATCNSLGSCTLPDGDIQYIFGDRSMQQIAGDFMESGTSPNDPLFLFHHTNMDRYFMEWQLNNFDKRPYYNYPENGYVQGINLDDVVSDEYPFENVFNVYENDGNIDYDLYENGNGNPGPYTFRDIFDRTTVLNAPFTFDTVLDLIARDD